LALTDYLPYNVLKRPHPQVRRNVTNQSIKHNLAKPDSCKLYPTIEERKNDKAYRSGIMDKEY
jgi:hypothetical protein